MKLRVLAPLLAASLALATITANPASALDRTQRNVLLLGLGTLAIAGALAANQNHRDYSYTTRAYPPAYPPSPYYGGTPYYRPIAPPPPAYYRPVPPPPPAYYNREVWLPGSCQFQVNTRYGVQTVMGGECLAQHAISTSRLPDRCEMTVNSPWGDRRVFGTRCLTGEGYRVSSR